MRRIVFVALLLALVCAVVAPAAGCGGEEIDLGTSNIDMAKDEAVKAGILAIQTGIVAAIGMGESAPGVVDQATLGAFVAPWPENPYTGKPMAPGAGKGDYTYENLGGPSYRLTGHLSDGEYVKP